MQSPDLPVPQASKAKPETNNRKPVCAAENEWHHQITFVDSVSVVSYQVLAYLWLNCSKETELSFNIIILKRRVLVGLIIGLSLSESDRSRNQVFPQDADAKIALNYEYVVRVSTYIAVAPEHPLSLSLSRKFSLRL